MHKALGYFNQTVILGAQLIAKDPDSSSKVNALNFDR